MHLGLGVSLGGVSRFLGSHVTGAESVFDDLTNTISTTSKSLLYYVNGLVFIYAILRNIVKIRNISAVGKRVRGEQNADFGVRLS